MANFRIELPMSLFVEGRDAGHIPLQQVSYETVNPALTSFHCQHDQHYLIFKQNQKILIILWTLIR